MGITFLPIGYINSFRFVTNYYHSTSKILIFLKRRSCQGEARCPRVRVHCHPIWPSFLSLPLQNLCDVPLTFFRYKTRYQRSEVIGPLWPCVAESPKKKINYKKNYEDDFAHYCYYCCYCPPILFSKKIKKKNAYLFSPPNEYCFFFFLLLCTYLTLTS